MARTKILKKFLLCALWDLVIIFLVLETILRFYIKGPLFYNIDLARTNRLGIYMLSPNKDLIYEPKPNTGQYNSFGYRGKPYPIEKNFKKRIIFLGDSVTEGLNINLGDRFSDLLSRHFIESCEIINLGVCGYNFLQEFEYFKEKGIPYKPDYVIFMIAQNDFLVQSGEINKLNEMLSNMKSGGFYYHYYNAKRFFERILLHSNLYKSFLYILLSCKQNPWFHGNGGRLGETLDNQKAIDIIEEIRKLSLKCQFKLYFIFLPTRIPCADFYKIKEVFIREKVNSFDLDEYFRNNYDSSFIKNLFYDLDHLNKEGNKVVAEILLDNLYFKNELPNP